MQNKSYTYILTNNNGKVMYIGVTADLFKRIKEHISRETQLKNWKRAWKDALVEKYNPQREDLFKKLEEGNPIGNLPISSL